MGAKRPWGGDFFEIVVSGTAKFGAKALMMVSKVDYRATRGMGDSEWESRCETLQRSSEHER
jgi:hypothetical protein